jgi:TetR/AcrR family fatty acid metabolism transcriptional regulator
MASTRAARSARLPPDARIADILVQARRELADKGHDGFLVGDVAARCGVSEATIYRYFPTKRELLMRVAEEWLSEILEVEPQVAREPDVLVQLRLVVRYSLEVIRKEPALTRYVLLQLRIDPDYRSTPIYALNLRFTGTVLDVIKRGIAEGAFRSDVSSHLVRDMIFGCIEHRAWSYLGGGRDYSVEATAEAIVSIAVQGLAAGPLRERERVGELLARVEAGAHSLGDDVRALRTAVKQVSAEPRRRPRRDR